MSTNYLGELFELVHHKCLLPLTGVNPFRGFIRPTLRAIRVDPYHLESLSSCLKRIQQTPKRVGHETSSGTHPGQAIIKHLLPLPWVFSFTGMVLFVIKEEGSFG